MPITTSAIEPDGERAPARAAAAPRGSSGLALRRGLLGPGHVADHRLAGDVRLVARLALLRLARAPPCSGTGSRAGGCRRVGPFAGAEDGPPSLFGPCGVATMMNRCQVPLASPSESSEATLRNQARGSCRSSAPARGSRASGSAVCIVSVSGWMPRGTSGSSENVATASSSDASRALNGRRAAQHRRADLERVGEVRRAAVAARATPGCSSRNSALGVGQERPLDAGTARSPRRASPGPRRSTPGCTGARPRAARRTWRRG